MLISLLSFSVFSVSALAEEPASSSEKNIVTIDVSDVKIRPANFNADYERDLNDLIQQFKQMHKVYNQTKNELKAAQVAEKRIELEQEAAFFEDYFESQSRNMLKLRYDDNKNIRSSVIQNYNMSKQADTISVNYSFPWPGANYYASIGGQTIFDTGNYGETSGSGTATYSHSSNNNVSKVESSNPIWCPLCQTTAKVQNGVVFGVKVGYPGGPQQGTADIRFYNQTAKAALYCPTSGSAEIIVDNIIYNVDSNQLMSTYNFVKQSGYNQLYTIDKGPLFVYFTNFNLGLGTYAAFTSTYSSVMASGDAYVNANGPGQGIKWENIDVYFH